MQPCAYAKTPLCILIIKHYKFLKRTIDKECELKLGPLRPIRKY